MTKALAAVTNTSQVWRQLISRYTSVATSSAYTAATTAASVGVKTPIFKPTTTITGSTITPTDFDPTRLPDHLRMNFAITDAAGTVIAMSRSLAELRTDGVGRTRKPLRRKVFTDWTADERFEEMRAAENLILTITEGGYNFSPSTGEFDATNPDIVADLEEGFAAAK